MRTRTLEMLQLTLFFSNFASLSVSDFLADVYARREGRGNKKGFTTVPLG